VHLSAFILHTTALLVEREGSNSGSSNISCISRCLHVCFCHWHFQLVAAVYGSSAVICSCICHVAVANSSFRVMVCLPCMLGRGQIMCGCCCLQEREAEVLSALPFREDEFIVISKLFWWFKNCTTMGSYWKISSDIWIGAATRKAEVDGVELTEAFQQQYKPNIVHSVAKRFINEHFVRHSFYGVHRVAAVSNSFQAACRWGCGCVRCNYSC